MEAVTLISVCGTIVGIIAGGLAIRRHFAGNEKAQILNPTHQSENGGRYLAVVARIPKRGRRKYRYWIAVQPDDCRSEGVWWPQNRPLDPDKEGYATLSKIRLGREGYEGTVDVGKTFTIGLFQVMQAAQRTFSEFADRDDAMRQPDSCKLLHSVDVRRVRQ